MKSSLTETNEKMRNNKSSLKNQIKKNEFLNTTNEENHINKNKKIKDNKIKNKNEEPTQKIIIKKRLFVKLKNSQDNNFSSKKKKSFNKNEKKYNSAEEKEKNNNKTYYTLSGFSKDNHEEDDDKKKDNKEHNLYYKRLKTIDLKIKKLRENKNKEDYISLNKEMKNNLKGRSESVKERSIKKERKW